MSGATFERSLFGSLLCWFFLLL